MSGEAVGMGPAEPVRITYIGGYGRSGSSVLDQTLSRLTGAVSTGELCQIFGWAHRGMSCSCGEPIADCRLWRPVLTAVLRATGSSLSALHEATTDAEVHGGNEAAWVEAWDALFRALQSRGVCCVIDSSKSAGGRRRPELLGQLQSAQLTGFVQLHRDLPAVINSRRRGNNLRLESGERSRSRLIDSLRGATGWWQANRLAQEQSKLADTSIALHYEEMAEESPEIAKVFRCPHYLDPHDANRLHAIAGNRVLRSGWDGSLSADTQWRNDLPIRWRLFGQAVQWIAVRRNVLPLDDQS